MRVTNKGQVTIPGAIRRKAGMLPGTEVEFVHDRKGVHLRPARTHRGMTKRERDVADTLDRLRGSATIKMSTQQIMALTRGQ